MNIRTVIIEDEINARKALENMLSFYCEEINIVGHASSVRDAITLINDTQPNLLMLDVHLTDGTSFELIKKIKKHNIKIVFVTAYDKYALQALKLSALDYLLKPVKPNELRAAIKKVINVIENEEQVNVQLETFVGNLANVNQDKKIILNTNDNIFVIEISKLVHCEANENYTNIFVEEKGKIIISKTLKEFEEMLSLYGFFRIHQSHLINLNYVECYKKKGVALLKTGESFPVSTRRKEGFVQALKEFNM